jgi:hypothetical protein
MQFPVYLNGSAFWIVHHDAIDAVSDLAMQGWHKAKEMGLACDVSFALGCAMQMLCADPTKHTVAIRPDLWVADCRGKFSKTLPDGRSWKCEAATGTEQFPMNPSIIFSVHAKIKPVAPGRGNRTESGPGVMGCGAA